MNFLVVRSSKCISKRASLCFVVVFFFVFFLSQTKEVQCFIGKKRLIRPLHFKDFKSYYSFVVQSNVSIYEHLKRLDLMLQLSKTLSETLSKRHALSTKTQLVSKCHTSKK